MHNELLGSALSAVAWILAVANIWGYGRSVKVGASIGFFCASTFLALASVTQDTFMAAANVVFLSLHSWNFYKATRPGRGQPKGEVA